MELQCKRIIIDTNLWINFLISKNFSALDNLISNKEIILVFSKELLEEFFEVASRPKFQNFFTLQDVYDLLEVIQEEALFVEVVSEVKVCRDAKDDFLLALAKDAEADFILTEDKDLLVLNPYGKTNIITLPVFLSVFA